MFLPRSTMTSTLLHSVANSYSCLYLAFSSIWHSGSLPLLDMYSSFSFQNTPEVFLLPPFCCFPSVSFAGSPSWIQLLNIIISKAPISALFCSQPFLILSMISSSLLVLNMFFLLMTPKFLYLGYTTLLNCRFKYSTAYSHFPFHISDLGCPKV